VLGKFLFFVLNNTKMTTPQPTVVPPVQVDVSRYYTHLSLVLFVLGLLCPRGFLKTALLLNSIFVGLMGNVIIMKNIESWGPYYGLSNVLIGNFLTHTLPMFLSFIVLFGCPPENGKTSHYLLFLSGLFLLWSCIPSDGRSMSEKVYDSYRMSVGVLVLVTVFVTVSTCKTIEYFRG
jgi:hypothetical protein